MATNTATPPSTASKAPAGRILPVSVQSFPKIRENGYACVDKTPRIYPLVTGGADKAPAQIDGKEYALPWTGGGKKVFKVGVSFDRKKRNIGKWASAVGG